MARGRRHRGSSRNQGDEAGCSARLCTPTSLTPTAISDISELGAGVGGLYSGRFFITDVQEIKRSIPQYFRAAKAADNSSGLLRKRTEELMGGWKNHRKHVGSDKAGSDVIPEDSRLSLSLRGCSAEAAEHPLKGSGCRDAVNLRSQWGRCNHSVSSH